MSSQVYETPRQGMNARQAETVTKLLQASLEELRAVGHEALTIRTVAHRAGVSPATAYVYFASKNHLFAELFYRHISTAQANPGVVAGTPQSKVKAAVRRLTDRMSEEPQLSAAVTPALLGSDPDVARLRMKIGAEFIGAFSAGLGIEVRAGLGGDRILEVLLLALSGALLQAGMGLMTYDQIGDQLEGVVDVILRGVQ